MKIVHFLPALTKGGGERVAVDLANHAAQSGHDTIVVSAFKVDETILRYRISKDIDVRYIVDNPGNKLLVYLKGMFWLIRNWQWLKSVDVLHCHLTYAAIFGSIAFIFCKITGRTRPIVVETYHSVGMPIPKWQRRFHAMLARNRDALALMAEDSFWTEFAGRNHDLQCEIIPNGVEFEQKLPIAEEQSAYLKQVGIPESCELIIGTVGQLRAERKPVLMVDIFKRIALELGDDVHFLLVGDGEEFDSVRAAIAESGMEQQIHTPGVANDPTMPMSVMDLYLTINVGAITGIAAMEAAALGAPVIAFQNVDFHQYNDNDWIWSNQDPDVIAAHAIDLMRDENARSNLSLAQKNHVLLHHSVQAMSDRYYQLYDKALQLKPNDQN